MANNETIADIVAEMRGIRVREFQDYADRLEAAHRRERNRNFHRFATADEAAEAWHKHEANDTGEEYCAECPFNLGEECARGSVCTIGWLYAEAQEGGANG